MSWKEAAEKVPEQQSNYFKFEAGPNKLRILSEPIFGYEYWNKDNKPVRSKEAFTETPTDARLNDEGEFQQKFFWAFIVWNYKANRMQLLEVTQVSIQRQITDLIENADWGDPRGYDLTILKKGEKLNTEYTVQPAPPKEVGVEIHRQYRNYSFDLEALFTGGDPFKGERDDKTPENPFGGKF